MVFNATFNNISVISWQSVLLMEKITDLTQVSPLAFSSTCNRTYTHLNSADSVPPHDRRETDLPEAYRLMELAVKSLVAMFSLLNLRFT